MFEIIPLKLILRNFRSHYNTEIDFGQPDWKIFITGDSGSGKTTILKAFQYLFGREINGYTDFFHEDKEGNYAKIGQIKLEVFNQNYEFNKTYGVTFTLVLDVIRDEEKVKEEWHVETGDDRFKINKQDLSLFCDFEDPFTFVPSHTLDTWMQLSPLDRYKRVMHLIGVTETHKKFEDAKKRRDETDQIISKYISDLALVDKDIEVKKKDYDTYLLHEHLTKEQLLTERELLLARATTALNEHFEYISKQDEVLSAIEKNRETYTSEARAIKYQEDKLAALEVSEKQKQAEIAKKQVLFENLNREKYALSQASDTKQKLEESVGSYPPQEEVESACEKNESQLSEQNYETRRINSRIKEIKKELKKLENDTQATNPTSDTFLQELQASGIRGDYFFKFLNIKPGMEKWAPLIESALGGDREAIFVKKKDIERAYSIRKKKFPDYPFSILGIKKVEWYSKEPRRDFRNWKDIIEIIPITLPQEEIEAVLNRKLGNVFFIEDRHEKDVIFDVNRSAVAYCLDLFTYLNYKSEKAYIPKHLFIGKLGIEVTKTNLKSENQDLQLQLGELSRKTQALKDERLQLLEMREHWSKYLAAEQEIEDWANKGKTLESLSSKIEAQGKELRDLQFQIEHPDKSKSEIQNKIEEWNRRKKSLDEEFSNLQNEQTTLRQNLEDTAKTYQECSQEWITVDKQSDEEDQIPLEEIDDGGDKYASISREDCVKFPLLRNLIKDPTTIIQYLITINAQLDVLPHFDTNIPSIYQESLDKREKLSRDIEASTIQLDDINQDMVSFKNEINEKIAAWQEIIKENFRTIIKDMQLEGELKVNIDNKEEGMFRIDYSVSSTKGGAPRTNMESFSDGEKARISMAFLVSVIKERASSFFIWDEFEGALDDLNRSLVGQIINQHIPSKAIVISPLSLVKQHLQSFQRILYVAKDTEGNSLLKHLDTDQRGFMEGTLFEFLGNSSDSRPLKTDTNEEDSNIPEVNRRESNADT